MESFEAVDDVDTRDSRGVMVLDCRTPVAGAEQESTALSLDLILESRKQFVEGDGGDADADIREAVGED